MVIGTYSEGSGRRKRIMKKLSELLFVILVSLGVSTVASYLKLWREI